MGNFFVYFFPTHFVTTNSGPLHSPPPLEILPKGSLSGWAGTTAAGVSLAPGKAPPLTALLPLALLAEAALLLRLPPLLPPLPLRPSGETGY